MHADSRGGRGWACVKVLPLKDIAPLGQRINAPSAHQRPPAVKENRRPACAHCPLMSMRVASQKKPLDRTTVRSLQTSRVSDQ
jgi:hypothetical protein